MSTFDTIADIHWEVLTHFRWRPDKEVFDRPEHWQSFAEEVRNGDVFEGDCDDFMLTCGDLIQDAIRAGKLPTETQTFLAVCHTQSGEVSGPLSIDHAVLSVVVGADGRWWMLDNRNRRVVDVMDSGYINFRVLKWGGDGKWRTLELGDGA